MLKRNFNNASGLWGHREDEWRKIFAKIPYVQGRDAFDMGVLMLDNPYAPNSGPAIKWACGWIGKKQSHFYIIAWRTGYIAAADSRETCPCPAKSTHAEYWFKGYRYGLRQGRSDVAVRMRAKLPSYLKELSK